MRKGELCPDGLGSLALGDPVLAFGFPFPFFMALSVNCRASSAVLANFVDIPHLAIIYNLVIIFGSQASQVSLLNSSLQRTAVCN